MSCDRWRDTYDSWKTREPDAAARICESCGSSMRYSHSDGWYCEDCEAWLEDQPGFRPEKATP